MSARMGWLITSAEQNVETETWQISSDETITGSDLPWGVAKQTLHGGKQEGVELLTIDNGVLQIDVCPTRGMGILEVRCNGERVFGWDSPVTDIVHPSYIRLEERGGIGWLEGFNEFVCRCGLESNGAPGEDVIIDNNGNESHVNLPLHGRIANIPASEVLVEVMPEPPYSVAVTGLVREVGMFGPGFLVTSSVSTEPGAATFKVEDTVMNTRAVPAEFEYLYHANFGPPLLERGAKLVAPVKRVVPRDAVAARGVESFFGYAGPRAGRIEECFFCEMRAARGGRTKVMLRNAVGNLGGWIEFSTRELPCFSVWKNMAAEADGYVTGLEPGTDYPNNRSFERAGGRVATIEPGGSRSFNLTFGLATTKAEVSRVAKEIRGIAGKAKPDIRTEPHKKYCP